MKWSIGLGTSNPRSVACRNIQFIHRPYWSRDWFCLVFFLHSRYIYSSLSCYFGWLAQKLEVVKCKFGSRPSTITGCSSREENKRHKDRPLVFTVLTGWFYWLLNYHLANYSESDADLSDLLLLAFVHVSMKLLLITDIKPLCACVSVCFCRDCSSHDLRDQPRHGDVLGDISVDGHGDHGEQQHSEDIDSSHSC